MLIKNLFVNNGVQFSLESAPLIYKTLTSLSSVATPLALITLGAQFELLDIKTFRREITFTVAVRNIIVPASLLFIAYFSSAFSGAHFAAFIALFATPIAVSSVPMAQELGGRTDLAGQLVVWTTLVSAATIFAFTFIFKLLGAL